MSSDDKPITGKAIGAKARSEKLTPEQRSDIARKAALAKHRANQKLVATHKGNFKDEFGIDIECYVLNDDHKTAVMSQRGMALALGLGDGGSRLPTFIKGKIISKYLGQELTEKLNKPLVFQLVTMGENIQPSVDINGYDVSILIDICKAIMFAKASGERVNENAYAQANIILGASAKSGIQELVYKLSGFDSTKEHFIQAFQRFVAEEAKKYEKEFPLELYEQWARIYNLTIPDRGWPWEFKHFTIKHIYYPLAKSNGKLLMLLRATKEKDGDRKKKLFQFLNEVGTRALRMQLGRVLEMAESSKTKSEYESKIIDRFGGQPEFEFMRDGKKDE